MASGAAARSKASGRGKSAAAQAAEAMAEGTPTVEPPLLDAPPASIPADPEAPRVEAEQRAAAEALLQREGQPVAVEVEGVDEVVDPVIFDAPNGAVEATPIQIGKVKLRDPIRHLEGCPQARKEAYDAQLPQRRGGGMVMVCRCIDCGESRMIQPVKQPT